MTTFLNRADAHPTLVVAGLIQYRHYYVWYEQPINPAIVYEMEGVRLDHVRTPHERQLGRGVYTIPFRGDYNVSVPESDPDWFPFSIENPADRLAVSNHVPAAYVSQWLHKSWSTILA